MKNLNQKNNSKLNDLELEVIGKEQVVAINGGMMECCNGTGTTTSSGVGWVNWLVPPTGDWEDEGCC